MTDDDAGDVEEGIDDERAAVALASAGLLTEQQARAWYLRDLVGLQRREAADEMGISISVLDDHTRRARDKLDAARETTRLAATIQGRSDVADAIFEADLDDPESPEPGESGE